MASRKMQAPNQQVRPGQKKSCLNLICVKNFSNYMGHDNLIGVLAFAGEYRGRLEVDVMGRGFLKK